MRAVGPLLAVRGLTKRFGGLVAVKDMAFEIGPGEIVGLIGPNGSGKSTVMKCVMGIERPTEGSVRIAGRARGVVASGPRADAGTCRGCWSEGRLTEAAVSLGRRGRHRPVLRRGRRLRLD